MNTIYSLLILQAGKMKEPAGILSLEETGHRVQTMMFLYDRLYKSADFTEMSLKSYLPPLIKNKGAIQISASLKDNRVSLMIENDGNGMPASISFEHSTEFGLVLIAELTRQLHGNIGIERKNGTQITVQFEK